MPPPDPFPARPLPAVDANAERLAQAQAAMNDLGRNADFVAASARSAYRVIESLAEDRNPILIVEGRVSPAYRAERFAVLNQEANDLIDRLVQRDDVDVARVENQGFDLPLHMWRDATHVNEKGRAAYTAFLARTLNEYATISPEREER